MPALKIFTSGIVCSIGLLLCTDVSFLLGMFVIFVSLIYQVYCFWEGGWAQRILEEEESNNQDFYIPHLSFNLTYDNTSFTNQFSTLRSSGDYSYSFYPDVNYGDEIKQINRDISSKLELLCDLLNDEFNVEFTFVKKKGKGIISVKDYGDLNISYCHLKNKFKYSYLETEVLTKREDPDYFKSLLQHFLTTR